MDTVLLFLVLLAASIGQKKKTFVFTPWGDVVDLQINAGLYVNIVVFHILYLKSECPEIKKEETEKHVELGHQKKRERF